jgi:hypothetical protein
MTPSALYVNVRRLVVDQAQVAGSARLADAIGRALQTEVVGGMGAPPGIPQEIAWHIARRLGDADAVTNAKSTAGLNRAG